MLKQLEIDALRADLASVSQLTSQLSESEDPLGLFQLQARKRMLEQQLQGVADRPASPSLGLFFGGRPVIGSYGISAEFGSKALDQVSNVIASRFASRERAVRSRGPIPQRRQAQMLVTDVVRGSFGFVLEPGSSDEADHTTIKEVISEVVDLLYRASDQDVELFEEIISGIDDRTLGLLKDFYRLLENNDATLRLVENERDLRIDRDDVRRGRERIDAINSILDSTITARGRLYIIPESRRFELVSPGGTLKGDVTEEAIAMLRNEDGNIGVGALGTWCTVELESRTVSLRGRDPRYSYKLVRVISSGDLKEQDSGS